MPDFSKRKQFILWMVAAVAASTGLAGVVVWEFRSTPRRTVLYLEGVPEKGKALFFGSKHCGICHAIQGSGGVVAPDLSGKRPRAPAVGWLTVVLWNHQPGMWQQMRGLKTGYPKMNQEEMAHMLAFLYQAAISDRAGDAEGGAKVFEGKGCAHCHSVRSVGGKTAPDLGAVAVSGGYAGWSRAMWNHAQSMVAPVTKELGGWPQFSGEEMNDLMAYVGGGKAAAGGQQEMHGSAERGWHVFEKNCMQCHSVRGQGGNVGPGLGPEKDLPLSLAQFSSVLWNHAPAMLKQMKEKGFAAPALQGEQVADLLMFLAGMRYFEPAGSPFLGQRLFTERGCAHCHGAEAQGARFGPNIRGRTAYTVVSFAAAMWAHGPKMQSKVEELAMAWPVLEATDVGDLISFLNSQPAGGTQLMP
ncbi:MAG: c-type cytochrome [Bryobacterales bacterium]|nr:c-type cytochrome [Bryobacterales bacterium]